MSVVQRLSPPARAAWPWIAIAAGLGFALTVVAFYPGFSSNDSLTQYAQALSGSYDDIHPPLMALLWRGCNALILGSGGLFVLLSLAFWIGLAQVASTFARGPWLIVACLCIGLLPPIWIVIAHVWKDVAMSASLLLGCAGAIAWRARHSRGALFGALLALASAVAFRHNAWTAAAPILVWCLWPMAPRRLGIAGASMLALALVALALVPRVIAWSVDAKPKQPWTAVLLWDLAAVSIAVDRQLLPAEVIAPDLSVADLRRYFSPWANPSIFDSNKIQLSFYVDYDEHKLDAVRAAWWGAVREHPLAYLAHRARLGRYLLFGAPAEAPRELVYVPQTLQVEPAGTVTVAVQGRIAQTMIAVTERLRATMVFGAAPYLLLAVLAAAIARSRSRSPSAAAALMLAVSAWCYALPLALIAGAAEFRYLHWTALASLLAITLAVRSGRYAPTGGMRSA